MTQEEKLWCYARMHAADCGFGMQELPDELKVKIYDLLTDTAKAGDVEDLLRLGERCAHCIRELVEITGSIHEASRMMMHAGDVYKTWLKYGLHKMNYTELRAFWESAEGDEAALNFGPPEGIASLKRGESLTPRKPIVPVDWFRST